MIAAAPFLVLSAALTIARCDLDHDLSKFRPTDADFVGLVDVDCHARRSGRDAQAEVLAAKYGYVSSYTTDHFIFETPDEQHGVAILSHEQPKSRLIRKLPSTGKGKVFFACEFTDCFIGVTEIDSACRDESLAVISNAVASLPPGKPFFMADGNRTIEVADPVLPPPAVVPRPVKLALKDGQKSVHRLELTEGDVELRTDPSLPDEGYRLSVRPDGISVASSGAAGTFYALQTLRQLAVRRWGALYLPCCEIEDRPRFGWRGLMMDEARHFYGKAAVLRMLEAMADHKLNVLHWHLADNEGWRLPIEGIPSPREAYSRDDLREIVAFARARHVRIVPEFDLPGHARALVRAKPDLTCFPGGAGAPEGAVDNVVCPGKDATVAFLRQLVSSLADLFPDSEFIHLGGDEANKVCWAACPHCRKRMADVGAKDVNELQAWLTRELAAAVAAKGRRLVGWTEILYGGMAPENTVLMSWLGAEGGIAAAKAGRDSVMCPHEWCYFNYEQCLEDDPFAYPWWSHPLSLERAYAYDPLAGMPEEARRHVLGGQCCLWSNQIHSEPELHWKAWPRACATAEVFWSPAETRDYADFCRRMALARKRLIAKRINCAPLE